MSGRWVERKEYVFNVVNHHMVEDVWSVIHRRRDGTYQEEVVIDVINVTERE